jgi:hypothetical protein
VNLSGLIARRTNYQELLALSSEAGDAPRMKYCEAVIGWLNEKIALEQPEQNDGSATDAPKPDDTPPEGTAEGVAPDDDDTPMMDRAATWSRAQFEKEMKTYDMARLVSTRQLFTDLTANADMSPRNQHRRIWIGWLDERIAALEQPEHND